MKLLFDENLPPRLAEVLQDQFPGSAHVHSCGLGMRGRRSAPGVGEARRILDRFERLGLSRKKRFARQPAKGDLAAYSERVHFGDRGSATRCATRDSGIPRES